MLLAFEILERIIKDYFSNITDTENASFTDCINCLISFTNSRFSKDFSIQAISFLIFCATKLAADDFGNNMEVSANNNPYPQIEKGEKIIKAQFSDKDDLLLFWFPLLAGNLFLTFFFLYSRRGNEFLCMHI